MTHRVVIGREAAKDLVRLSRSDPKLYAQVRQAIADLATDPRPHGCTKLTGRVGYRIRVREYRIIYDVDDHEVTVTVIRLGGRGSVYR